jgi:Kef-type K+ transport system membrane component KefB/voltage-gated potassium channel Kch
MPTPSLSVLVAAGELSPLVEDLGVCLVVAAALAVVFERLRIPTIAAFLAAGVLVGPVGMRLVHEQANIETISNLGLTLLLFVIGLEVNLKSLLNSGKTLLVTGLLQVPLTAGLGFLIFLGIASTGWSIVQGDWIALYLGIACAFSSTLLVVKALQTHLKLDSVSGRMCVGLLIFQDIWAIVIMALQPSFESPDLTPIALTFFGIATVAGVAALCSRFVLPAVFRTVARVPELVVTTALGWCFALGLFGAYLGDALGVLGIDVELSVSLEMGALIAGMSIATFPYAYDVITKVGHLRDFFITLFFLGLGMAIPIPDGPSVLGLAFVLAVVAMALRYVVFLPLLYLTGLDRRNALVTSTKMAQVSEFCLVISYIGLQLGHLDELRIGTIVFSFVITALVTPMLFAVADGLYGRIAPMLTLLGMRKPGTGPVRTHDEGAPRVVLLGFHRLASAVLHDLVHQHPELVPSTVVVDVNVKLHDQIRAKGVEVRYADIGSAETLRHMHLEHAEVFVSTVPDELLMGTTNAAIVKIVRELAPDATVVAVASSVQGARELKALGAHHVVLVNAAAATSVVPAIYAALNGNLEELQQARHLAGGSPFQRDEVMG